MKYLMMIIFILSLGAVNAQDITSNVGSKAIYNESTKSYDLVLTGISQKKAVDLVVDQIKAKSTTVQTVSGYSIKYSGIYSVTYQGTTVEFKTISEVRTFIKKDLKFLLENI